MSSTEHPIVVLSGGVGGAKMVWGLTQVLPCEKCITVANTADDFEHLGLYISPDVDTVIYTLAGVANKESGWGRAQESWRVLETLQMLGGESWFRLGDLDLATHLYRSERMRKGVTLTKVCAELCATLNVKHTVLPMSDDTVRTVLNVRTADGKIVDMDFQEYFVRHRCEPELVSVRFEKAKTARPNPQLIDLLRKHTVSAVIIAPSNPIVSINPILSFEEVRELLRALKAPVVAVSPIVASKALKGPLEKMMRELGVEVTPPAVAEYYSDFLNGFVVDEADADCANHIPIPVCVAPTVMDTAERKIGLARIVLDFCARLAH